MNADFLRPPSMGSDQSINGVFREKDDSGGSFYCEDYQEEESQEDQERRRAFAWYQVEKAREFYENAAKALSYLCTRRTNYSPYRPSTRG